MKFLLAGIITIYVGLLSPIKRALFGNTCRFNLTCSEYAKKIIIEKGVVKGSALSIARILKCQPFYNIKNAV